MPYHALKSVKKSKVVGGKKPTKTVKPTKDTGHLDSLSQLVASRETDRPKASTLFGRHVSSGLFIGVNK